MPDLVDINQYGSSMAEKIEAGEKRKLQYETQIHI